MPIEMVWNDLKFYLTNDCSLKSKIKKDKYLEYCNAKFDHLPKVIQVNLAIINSHDLVMQVFLPPYFDMFFLFGTTIFRYKDENWFINFHRYVHRAVC